MSSIDSPCVDICSLNELGDCLGCGRSLDEIAAWRQSSDEEKVVILKAAADRLATAAILSS